MCDWTCIIEMLVGLLNVFDKIVLQIMHMIHIN